MKLLRNDYLPNARVFVTSRPGDIDVFKELESCQNEEYTFFEITGFSSSEIDEYINNVFFPSATACN